MLLCCTTSALTCRLLLCRIQLAFQHTLTAVDWEQQTAEFQDAAGKPVSAPYSLLVGADGVNSKTRSLYQQHDPSLEVFLQPALKDFVGFSGISVDGYNAGAAWWRLGDGRDCSAPGKQPCWGRCCQPSCTYGSLLSSEDCIAGDSFHHLRYTACSLHLTQYNP